MQYIRKSNASPERAACARKCRRRVLALVFFVAPAWQERQRTGQWQIAGVAAALLVAPLAFGLYAYVRTWSPPAFAAPGVAAGEALEGLAQRLARNPDDPAGWRVVGGRYLAIGDLERSVAAYREAWSRTADPEQPGDYSGEAHVAPGGTAEIVIDRAAR